MSIASTLSRNKKEKTMIVTFCGHSDFVPRPGDKEKMVEVLISVCGDNDVEFYLGDYGGFDRFVFSCCKEYKKINKGACTVFVSPYLDSGYLSKRVEGYDVILYPELENTPYKFRITARNKFMIESSEIVIAYVKRAYGGAYDTFKYAEKKQKKIFFFDDKTSTVK